MPVGEAADPVDTWSRGWLPLSENELMRLYLSSFRLGDHALRLVDLVGGSRARVLLSMNALDHLPEANRLTLRARTVDDFHALGLRVQDLDLRNYFTSPDRIHDTLTQFDLIWFNGGNAFTLLMAMSQSGFVPALNRLLADDAIAYGGYSAGAVVAGPTLRGFDLVDSVDPREIVPAGYAPEIHWTGMNLVPYSIVPHYMSNHHESAAMNDVVKYLQDHSLPHKLLRDGEAILVDGHAEVHLRV